MEMQPDRDQPIGRQLKEYARHRRDQAAESDFELHPLARDILHVEVDRIYRPRKTSAPASWWPRLALGFGIPLVVAVIGVMLFSNSRDTRLAGNHSEPTTAMESDSPPQPAPNDSISLTAPVEMQENGLATSAAVPTNRTAGDSASTFIGRNQSYLLSNQVSIPISGPPPTSARRSVQPTSAAETIGPNEQPIQMASVLSRFQIQTYGQQLVVVDQDGSQYSGELQPVNPSAIDPSLSTTLGPVDVQKDGYIYEERPGAVFANNLQAQAAYFTATGTNDTLQLPVRFTGSVLIRSQEIVPPEPATTNRSYGNASGEPLVNMTGTAQVGTNEIQIDARNNPR